MNLNSLAACFTVLLLVYGMSLHATEGDDYYLARHLTGDNGLPQNSIKSIAPDENGFIWLAMENALVRYDGRNLKIHNKDNIKLQSSRFAYIFKDKKQPFLYAVTDLWQIVKIRKSQAMSTNLRLFDILKPLYPVNAYTRGKFGDFVTYYHHREIQDSFQIIIDEQQKVMVRDNNSIQWGNPSRGRYRFGFDISTYRFMTCNGSLYYLKDLSPRGLFSVTQEGVFPAALTGSRETAEAHCTIYLNDATGKIFILSGQHLYLVQQQPDKSLHLRLLLDNPFLKKTGVRSLYYDEKADRLYIGTAVSGLYIFERKQFNTVSAEGQDQFNNVFYGQMLWDDHSILTGKGYKFSEHGPVAYLPQVGNHADVFGSVIQRYRDGTIWTGALEKLSRISADGRKLMSSWEVKAPFLIYQGYRGILWLGTDKEGIYWLYPDSTAAPRLLVPLNEFVTSLHQETEDILWVGTTTNLYRLHLKQLQWDTIKPLQQKSIRSLYFAGRHELWITTYEDGIYLWKEGKVTHLPLDNNGFLKNAHCILEDRNHYFWITTNNGLFQASRNDLLRFAAGKQSNVYYHHYTKEKGFNTNEFNGGGCEPCGLKFNNGTSFSFPSLNGLVWFRPEAIRPVLPDNPIILDKVQVDGADVPVADTLMLSRTSGRVSLWTATSYLGNTDNMGMEYKIEGPGTGTDLWNPLVNDFISFNGPRSGTFVVTIRKQGGFGANNYVYKQLFIVIPKAFWETWWFISLLIIGISALVFLLIKMRVHFLEQKNKELEQVVSLRTKELRDAITQLEHTQQDLNKEVQFQRQLNASITHDIKTPIQYLTLSLKYLFIRKEREQATDVNEIAEVFRASERISQFTNSLTGYVKVRLGIEAPVLTALRPIAEQKIGMFSVAAEKVGNTFLNTIPESLQAATHPSLLDILLHNLIDNANKHTSKGTITIDATATEETIILRVTDTGRGMPEEQVATLNHFFAQRTGPPQNYQIGLGYLTIADILERLSGNIVIESKQGEGTTILLTLPANL